MYANKALDLATAFNHLPGLYRWTLEYDSFLGYMAGVLPLADAKLTAFIA